ncbi:MAG: hypothetical protein JJ979_25340 [Roseibium sp.]|nr:hypothetical protein [Roseibium sp.]
MISRLLISILALGCVVQSAAASPQFNYYYSGNELYAMCTDVDPYPRGVCSGLIVAASARATPSVTVNRLTVIGTLDLLFIVPGRPPQPSPPSDYAKTGTYSPTRGLATSAIDQGGKGPHWIGLSASRR